ncbi:hypothetical protein [Lentilactobacillus kosonis]|uniref:Metabolite transporter (DMT) superfamily n=1 Tax=Lentilactobacillus kosonis TaxID=2810561 RepID=A0A401FIZ1_9LACO|nr:hypothetical protein [Lentilactobacillus kosonis]GAY72268.1 metabolite transporter (DMT) superfamily [Lentilactobacillus kosonis]
MKRIAPLLVAIGAISYGIPGSLFQLAHRNRVTDSALLITTFTIAFVVFSLVRRCMPKKHRKINSRKLALLVIISGSSMGFTNTFYILRLNISLLRWQRL